jgi:hypothetical protein
MARGAIRQNGYEPRVLLRVGQVGDVYGVYRSFRIGFSGTPTNATSYGWEMGSPRRYPNMKKR